MQVKHPLILTAVNLEARAIQTALGQPVQAVGIGAKHLPPRADLANASVILLCGLAGGLDPKLNIGQVILDDPTGLITINPAFQTGTIHTAGTLISTPAQKADLFRQNGASAVDMEQSIVRAFAAKAGVQLIGIRAISDTANQVLDPAVVDLVDELGRPRPARIAAQLIRRPALIPYLRRLGKNTNIALSALAEAVRLIARQLEGK